MLSAEQVAVIAYGEVNTGDMLCAQHAEAIHGDEVRAYIEAEKVHDQAGSGWSFDRDEAFEAVGLRAYSRYEIHEEEAANVADLSSTDIVGALIGQGMLDDFAVDILEATYQTQNSFAIEAVIQEAIDATGLAIVRCEVDGEAIT